MFAFAIAAFTLTSCEDVPAPYEMPDEGDIDKPVVFEPKGSGTQDDPYNVAAIIQEAEKLDPSEVSADSYYFEGYVTGIKENYDKSGTYGNGSFYISDDEKGSNSFYVYHAYYFNDKKYTSGVVPQEGDKVVFYGKLTNYNGTLETNGNDCYLISINGQGGESGDEPTPGQPEGDGTLENPYNAVAAYQYAASLGKDEVSDKDIYIKGIVSNIKENYNNDFGTATYWISVDGTFDSDDSGNQFYIFRSKYLDNEKYASGDLLSIGDEVVVCGKVTNYYGNTPETEQNESYLYSLKKGEGDSSQDVGDPNALNGDFECWIGGQPNNWKSANSASNATLTQSTDAHSGTYSVCVGGTSSANKRLAYKELELKAGEYTMEFYVKAMTSDGASLRPGYAIAHEDGSSLSGDDYKYGNYVDDIPSTEWQRVTYTFTIETDGIYNVVVMNAKKPGKDFLLDDFKLTTGSTVIIE